VIVGEYLAGDTLSSHCSWEISTHLFTTLCTPHRSHRPHHLLAHLLLRTTAAVDR